MTLSSHCSTCLMLIACFVLGSRISISSTVDDPTRTSQANILWVSILSALALTFEMSGPAIPGVASGCECQQRQFLLG